MGKLPNQELEETFDLASLKLPQDIPLSLPSKIIEQRPDVRAAEEQLRSVNAQVGVAIAAMLPQFSITGALGGGASEFPWMFRSGGPFWNLIGGVTQPVFAGGTLLHSVVSTTAGNNTFTWNGKDSQGNQQPDGAYSVAVISGATGSGAALAFTVSGTVTGVVNNGGTLDLQLGAETAAFSTVQSVSG